MLGVLAYILNPSTVKAESGDEFKASMVFIASQGYT